MTKRNVPRSTGQRIGHLSHSRHGGENASPAPRTSAETSSPRRSNPDSLYQRHGLRYSRVRRERLTQPAGLDRTGRTDLGTGALESVTDGGNYRLNEKADTCA
ncbi:hypothetical protein HPB48_019288 [Haemaphysalis longicornis]|uniref:Uncharacterized protein n=1 Tax=Haemaphysalis longicornis TaxID=44386 RepID=A0A9J6GI85_HAELO|nr:hypothetical protein HPB48_019288 [Haemaphysalis longicornis]